MRAPIAGATNVMEAPFFDPDHYRSDSNQHWRHGCPHEQLARGEFEWLQLLTHPEIWAFEGATMRRVDGVDARRRPRRAARAPAPTHDRDRPARVKPITVMVTASGAPGTAALLHALRENGEREVRLVGTDMSERSVGRHLCDAFHIVPAGSRPDVPGRDARVAEREQRRRDPAAVVVRPRRARRARRPVPDAGARLAARTRSAARTTRPRRTSCCTGSGVRAPEFRRVNGAREVEAAARELGYPERPVCFKPVFSSGSRGFRILDPTVDRAHQLLNERPGSVAMRLEEAVELLPDEGGPDLLVMELATGGERDDRRDRERAARSCSAIRRRARRCAPGLAMYFVTLDDPAADARSANLIVEELGIEHFFNIQLVGDYVIEINPRISTIVYQEDLNLPYLGVKRALGEISRRRAAHATRRASARAEPRCAISTSSNSTRDPSDTPARAASRGQTRVRDRDRLGPQDMARSPNQGDKTVTNDPQVASGHARARQHRRASRGRTCRRCGGRGSTRGSSSSSAGGCTPRPTGRSTGTGALPRRLAQQFAAFARLAPQTDIFHFYFGLTLIPKSLQFPLLRLLRKKSVFHYLGSDIRGKTPGRARVRQARRRRDRRLVRRDPLGARGARDPAGPRPARRSRRCRRPTARARSSCTRRRTARRKARAS